MEAVLEVLDTTVLDRQAYGWKTTAGYLPWSRAWHDVHRAHLSFFFVMFLLIAAAVRVTLSLPAAPSPPILKHAVSMASPVVLISC